MLMEFTSDANANTANSCLMHDILNIEVNYYLKDLPNIIQIHFKLGLCKCVVKFPPQFQCTTALNEVLVSQTKSDSNMFDDNVWDVE